MPESLEQKLTEIVKYAAEVGARAAVVHDSGIFLQIGRFVRRSADLDAQVPTPAEFAIAAEFVTTISGPDSLVDAVYAWRSPKAPALDRR